MAEAWRRDPVKARTAAGIYAASLQPFADGRIAMASRGCQLHLEDLVCTDGPTTLTLEAPPGEEALAEPLFACLLRELLSGMTAARDTDRAGRPRRRRLLLVLTAPLLARLSPLAGLWPRLPAFGIEVLAATRGQTRPAGRNSLTSAAVLFISRLRPIGQ